MSKRKTTAEKIDEQLAKKAQMEAEIKILFKRQKEEERKARNHRICTRGAHMESLLPDTIGLSDARFFTFLEKTVANDFGRRTLAALVAEQAKDDANNGAAAKNEGEAPKLKSVAPKIILSETDGQTRAIIAAAPIGADSSGAWNEARPGS